MRACADLIDAVMGDELEAGARPPHLDAFRLDGDGEADGGRRLVRHIDMRAEAALALVEMRLEQLDAGPLHQSDHEAGGEYFRHELELARLWIELGHGLATGHAVGEAMLQPCFKRGLHGLRSRSGAKPAFSSPGMALSMPSHGLRKSKLRYSCISFTGS